VAFVFISYSRRDEAFAKYLSEALAERGREVWVDWRDLRIGDLWREAIGEAIDAADAFIPVITPDWASSNANKSELDRAIASGKRILPVLRRDPGFAASQLPGEVSRINWVFFREEDAPEEALASLVESLETDPAWVREHTHVLQKSTEWERNLRDPAYLLPGSALEKAEEWLAQGARRRPAPTPIQAEYVLASRKASGEVRQRRRRGVFISYRREETEGHAGRLYDRLAALIGEKNVFMDVDSIQPGVDFVSALREALDKSGVLIALIGPQWLDISAPDGRRRLDDSGDFVRLELEGALDRRITVVPVIVEGGTMPRADKLPASLVELPRFQALGLSHNTWRRDVGRLIDELPDHIRRSGRRWLPGGRM
jgi:hypothetical protein